MLVFVMALVLLERLARRNQRYASSAQRPRPMPPQRLRGWHEAIALGLGVLPVVVGFVGPATYLVISAAKRLDFAGLSPALLRATLNTVSVSALATLVVLLAGFAVAYAARLQPGRATGLAARVATLGYAVPGTVLAIGILIPVAAFDRSVDGFMRSTFGWSTGLLLLGTGGALVYAYAARFLAISVGGIESGLSRLPLSYDHAARTLGQGPGGTLRPRPPAADPHRADRRRAAGVRRLHEGTAGHPAAPPAQLREPRHPALWRSGARHLRGCGHRRPADRRHRHSPGHPPRPHRPPVARLMPAREFG